MVQAPARQPGSTACCGGGAKLAVEHLYVDGDTTVAELMSTSTTNEGAPFANRYCWVCRFDGDTIVEIVEVRAYVDSEMVDYTVHHYSRFRRGSGSATLKPRTRSAKTPR